MVKLLRPAIVLLLLLTAITGLAYPFAVTGIAQLVFPRQASGSLIMRDGKPVGSGLIGQSFTDPKYFWGRPSATTPQPYNGTASGGSNLGPSNPALTDAVADAAGLAPLVVSLPTVETAPTTTKPAYAGWPTARACPAGLCRSTRPAR